MLQEYFVSYLALYKWNHDPDASPDKLVSVKFTAGSESEARQMAAERIPEVIASYTDEEDDVTEDDIEITVRSWSQWGEHLSDNWDAICSTQLEDEDDEDDWRDTENEDSLSDDKDNDVWSDSRSDAEGDE